MIVAPHFVDQCAWTAPGANPYLGTASEALATMPIPSSAQAALLEQIKHGRITRTTQISAGDTVGYMAFSVRSVCRVLVAPASWGAGRVELADVFCASGYCVGRPGVCGNWYLASVPAGMHAVPDGAGGDGPALSGASLTDTQAFPNVLAIEAPTFSEPAPAIPNEINSLGESKASSALVIGSFDLQPYASSFVATYTPAAPINEPSTLALCAGGAGLCAWRYARRT